MSKGTDLEALYGERNILAMAFAVLAEKLGWPVWVRPDPQMGWLWPILFVQTPAGQVSWHLHKDDYAAAGVMWPDADIEWDGHSTAEKYARLRRLVAAHEPGLGNHEAEGNAVRLRPGAAEGHDGAGSAAGQCGGVRAAVPATDGAGGGGGRCGQCAAAGCE